MGEFLKKQRIKIDYSFILSSLRHREIVQLTQRILIFSAVMVAIVTFLSDIIEFIFPLEHLKETIGHIERIEGNPIEKRNLSHKIMFTVVLILGMVNFVGVFMYILVTPGYFELKFRRLRGLQILIENLYLSKGTEKSNKKNRAKSKRS